MKSYGGRIACRSMTRYFLVSVIWSLKVLMWIVFASIFYCKLKNVFTKSLNFNSFSLLILSSSRVLGLESLFFSFSTLSLSISWFFLKIFFLSTKRKSKNFSSIKAFLFSPSYYWVNSCFVSSIYSSKVLFNVVRLSLSNASILNSDFE